MRRTILTSIYSAIALAMSLAPAGLASAHEQGGKSEAIKHLEGLDGERFEVGFLKQMIHHHGSGIEMARLAAQKSKRKEVRNLAEEIASGQHKEREQMTAWLKSWHGESPEPHFRDQEMESKTRAQMAKLRESEGDEFDRVFLASMIEHHRDGVTAARLVPERSKREELISAAKKMVDGQGEEMRQMTSWHGRWFGEDSLSRPPRTERIDPS